MGIKHSRPVPPFMRYCSAIIPTMFDDSLSYYEALCALNRFIQTNIVEVINNNATVTKEYEKEVNSAIKLFAELSEYVHNYFDNLDVQDEVNQKLDEMAESGELSEAIQLALSYANYQKSVFGERIINNQSTNVACVGDSLTWCQKPGDTSTQLTTWSSMLEDFVNDWSGNASLLTCDNYGVKGQVSSYSIDHFNDYLANSPNVIFWAYGTNDMTQGVTVDQFLANLKEFYGKCIDNSIEMIVIIAPPSFQSTARRNKMYNLAKAERAFCEKYGIRYVDMFEYVDNLYSSQAYAHNVLQSDNTHFSDYTCYRDAIISSLLSMTFNQDSKVVNYIDVGEARDFFHCNGNVITVGGGVNMFNRGWRLRQEQAGENAFSINIHLNKKSKVYFLTYGNSTAGKIDYSVDGDTAVQIDTMLNSGDASTTNKNLCEYIQIGGVLDAGLHQIAFDNPVYPSASGGRIYVFGFIVEEIENIMIDSTRLRQLNKQMLLWSGNSTSLSDVELNQDLHKYNRLLLEFGTTATNISYAEVYPHDPTVNFDKDGNNTEIPYSFAIPTGSGLIEGTLTVDHVNNSVSFTGNGTVALRRIVGFLDNNTKNFNAMSLSDITNAGTLQ